METKDYYKTVGTYYDQDANMGFEARVKANAGLERIRNSFRSYIEKLEFQNALEIGCGPGFDAEWLAKKYPDRNLVAIDVSEQMSAFAAHRLQPYKNAQVRIASDLEIPDFKEAPFGLVYVFFGALNTVDNLHASAEKIYQSLAPGGHAVLTFVNKWYLREMVVQLLKLQIGKALARIRKVWGGYSTTRFLPSQCYSPSQVRDAFSKFEEVEHRGFSIAYPAWYNFDRLYGKDEKEARLWRLDEKLNQTPFWKFGEYTLFVLRKPAG